MGRNGAGKSTLLKILSRITEPTYGKVKIRGRVTSLLEVGTGFHPDLTGRENILLNGAIMGMSYREIKQKFDEIVAFAEVERFLDTPLKRYSSGMFMRLGFAIAAHLDSDILIVDEVLAVGDTLFQEKCLKKMNEIGAQNRTIFFVSHHINSVLALCNKGIFLEHGKLQAFEPIEQCVNRYIQTCPTSGLEWTGDEGDEHVRITRATIRPSSSLQSFFSPEETTVLDIAFDILSPHADLVIGFSVWNEHNQVVAKSHLSDHAEYCTLNRKQGSHALSFHLDFSLFHPGEYHIKLECFLFKKKQILTKDILLKFALYSQNSSHHPIRKSEYSGISLGNRWTLEKSLH